MAKYSYKFYKFAKGVTCGSYSLVTSPIIIGKENIPDTNYIAYANHQSIGDIALMALIDDDPLHFMAKNYLRFLVLSKYWKGVELFLSIGKILKLKHFELLKII